MQQLEGSMLSSSRRRKKHNSVWHVAYSPAYFPLPMLQARALRMAQLAKGLAWEGKFKVSCLFGFGSPSPKDPCCVWILHYHTAPSFCNYLLIATFLPTRNPVRIKNACPTTALNGPVQGLPYAYFINLFPDVVKKLESWEDPITSLSFR